MRTGRPPRPLFDRFVDKIQLDLATGCWEWIGGLSPAGYGIFVIRSELTKMAHRVSYEWFVGEIPPAHDIHHACKNRKCICPSHLQAVVRADHGVKHQRDQTHCRYNHELTPDNLLHYKTPSGKPRWKCKQCSRDQQKARLLEYRKLVPRKPHASSAKTHCKRGHPLGGENLKVLPNGGRRCIKCYAMLQTNWRNKHKLKLVN